MFCPNCRSEYRPGFLRCSDCDIALVDHLPEPRRTGSIVKILDTQDRALADIVASLLRAKSIEFFTKFGNPDVSVFGFQPTQIWVAVEDEQAARDTIAESAGSEGTTFFGRKPGHAIQITHYSRRTGQPRTEDIHDPSWQIIEREIRTMDRFEKPLIFLLTAEDDTESDCMAITGGDGVYHVQFSDADSRWQEAVNPRGGSREIDVWTSDQGFTTEERFTWSTEDALRIAKFFWEEQKPAPDIKWS